MFIAFVAAAVTDPPKATAIDPASWFSADDYPAEAQRKGIEGRSGFEVDVDTQGKPTACRITHSSGSPILDQTTCDVVLKRAQFEPAMSHGHAVAGRYSQTATWKLQGTTPSNGYSAAIVDFRKDPDHPTCSTLDKGFDAQTLCDNALKQFNSGSAANRPAQMVILMSVTTGSEQRYKGDPGWGRRLSFLALDIYSTKDGSKRSCAIVAKEGPTLEVNPCAPYADAAALSGQDRSSAKKMHIERSIFVLENGPPATGKCK